MLKRLSLVTGALLVALLGGLAGPALADDVALAKGKELAFDRKKGNCLACHMIDDGDLPGNLGPPLLAMQARYPDRAVLRAQIWDSTVKNPRTTMPPFGRHGILSEQEIDLITDYIHSL
jgi:sulfur-oxidizing protein SoxX